MPAIITLTTDFGLTDNFVGVMKGVILSLAPDVRLVDLTHEIPSHQIATAAFSLLTAYKFFPQGTIHAAVVDPGVGSTRSILAVRASGHIFLAPDNGLLSFILDEAVDFEARKLENPDMRLKKISRTFHGRDIIAPAAAHLALGRSFEETGPRFSDPIRLPSLLPRTTSEKITGRVIAVDKFGNLITNIKLDYPEPGTVYIVKIGKLTLNGLSESYSQAAPGDYLAIIGGAGRLEIARNKTRAESPPDLALESMVVVFKEKLDAL